MSVYEAIFSFANHLEDVLAEEPEVSLTVYMGKGKLPVAPYLSVEPGPGIAVGTWQEAKIVNLRLVVSRTDAEPLEATVARFLKAITKRLYDSGQIVKYDYSTSPKTITGSVVYQFRGETPDLETEDENRSEIILTYELFTNTATP